MYDRAERDRIVKEVAERAGAEIRRRAEVEAARLREERLRVSEAFLGDQRAALAELDRATLEHFGAVKAQTVELLVALRKTIERANEPLAAGIAPPADPVLEPVAVAAAPSAPAPPAPEPAPHPEPAPEPEPVSPPEPVAPPGPIAEPVQEQPWPDEPVADQPAPEALAAEQPAPEATAAEQPSAPAAPPRKPFPYQSTESTALAAQMAAAGSSRDDIIRSLRERFSIMDPEPIADEALSRYGS